MPKIARYFVQNSPAPVASPSVDVKDMSSAAIEGATLARKNLKTANEFAKTVFTAQKKSELNNAVIDYRKKVATYRADHINDTDYDNYVQNQKKFEAQAKQDELKSLHPLFGNADEFNQQTSVLDLDSDYTATREANQGKIMQMRGTYDKNINDAVKLGNEKAVID